MQAYALIHTAVRFSCTNQTAKGRTSVLGTPGSGKLLDSITSVFGAKLKDSLIDVMFDINDGCTLGGMISKAVQGCGMSSTDRQFLFVNKRPIDFPKMQKVINEVYKSFNMHQYPVFIFNITMPSDEYDINVTPDKRQVMIHKEKQIVEAVKEQVKNIFEPSRYTLPVHTPSKEASRTQDGGLDPAPSSAHSMEVDESEFVATVDSVELETACRSDRTTRSKNSTVAPVEDETELETFSQDLDAELSLSKFSAKSKQSKPKDAPLGAKGKARAEQPRISSFLVGQGKSQPAAEEEDPDDSAHGSASTPSPSVGASRSRRRRRGGDEPDSDAPNGVGHIATPKRSRMETPQDSQGDATAEEEDAGGDAPAGEVPAEEPDLLESQAGQHMSGSEAFLFHSRSPATAPVSDDRPPPLTQTRPPACRAGAVDGFEGGAEPAPCAGAAPASNIDSDDVENVGVVTMTANVDWEDIARRVARAEPPAEGGGVGGGRATARGAGGRADEATSGLEMRVIGKEDFLRMRVLGQFNLGFIIAELRGDLYILDQHACDEKFRFEALQESLRSPSRPRSPCPIPPNQSFTPNRPTLQTQLLLHSTSSPHQTPIPIPQTRASYLHFRSIALAEGGVGGGRGRAG